MGMYLSKSIIKFDFSVDDVLVSIQLVTNLKENNITFVNNALDVDKFSNVSLVIARIYSALIVPWENFLTY
jgi:hypothetical protein